MIDLRSLRRHYPDQVRGSRAGSSPLSLVSPDSPSNVLILIEYKLARSRCQEKLSEKLSERAFSKFV